MTVLTQTTTNAGLTLNSNQPHGVYSIDGRMMATDPSGNLNVFCDCPIEPKNITRSVDGLSHNGVTYEASVNGMTVLFSIDMKSIFGGLTKELSNLADRGINIPPNRINDFKRYIQRCSQLSLPIKYIVERTGFIESDLAYNLAGTIVKAEEEENNKDFCYRPRKGKAPDGISEQGNWKSYTEEVLNQCVTDPLKFAICLGVTSFLAELMGLEGGGIHVFGPSGSGKSTMLQAMASVVGSGSEPGDGSQDSYIIPWSSTANGLEAIIAERSGMGVCIDELGAFKSNKLSSALYKLLAGSGEARMTSNLNLAKQHKASVFMLSTGELSIEDKIRQSNAAINAGLLARLPSVLIEPIHMALEGESLTDTAQRIERFKDACTDNGGQLAPKFLQGLFDAVDSKVELEALVQERWDEAVEVLSEYASNSIQRRVIRRFALILTAGHLAAELELLPWSEEEITNATLFMIERWQVNVETGKSDLERAVERLKDWIRANFHSFPDTTSSKIKGVVNGYRYQDQYILILPEVFRNLCQNVTPKQVGNKLKEMEVLKHDAEKQQCRIKIPSIGKRQYFYCIDYAFIEDWLESDQFLDEEDELSTAEVLDQILNDEEIEQGELLYREDIL
ncbi:MAG: DUF927 domain-containing protein [Colwellia sp.]